MNVFSAKYDAWGQQAVTTNTLGFHRGYTGHEMLPEFGLINMNGRLYDPYLARFLSPDNYVQMPDFSQSFNRYSYCLNNPLKYVDPDGEIAWLAIGFAIAGAYMGGVATNKGELNPFHWDYSNPLTYGGILIGGIAGGITGSALAGSTAWNIGFSIGNPYLSAGVTIGATATSGFQYGFHWTTSAGGGYDSVEKATGKAVERAGETFDKYIDQYHQYMDNIHTGLDVIGLIPGGDLADLANVGLYLLEEDLGNAGLSAVAAVPFIGGFATTGKHAWKAGDVISSLGSKYTKSSPINGINIHKSYKVNDVIPNHAIKEYRKIPGVRPDFVDFDNHIIYELKPANKNSILKGYKQLDKYKYLFDKYRPVKNGE